MGDISFLTAWMPGHVLDPTQMLFLSLSAHEEMQWLLPTGLSTSSGNLLNRGSSVDPCRCQGASWQVWLTLILSGLTPSGVQVWPKKLASSHLSCSLSALNLIRFSLALSITRSKFSSCSFSVNPIPVTPGRPSRALSSSFWKTSWDTIRPKGSLVKRYLLKGLLNVVSSELGSGSLVGHANTPSSHGWYWRTLHQVTGQLLRVRF